MAPGFKIDYSFWIGLLAVSAIMMAARAMGQRRKKKPPNATKGYSKETNLVAEKRSEKPDDLKVTGLFDDCLFEIFKYLNDEDLLHIAGTNERLKAAGRVFFERKYREKAFKVSNNYKYDEKLLPSVAYLKHFGDLIKKMHVDYTHPTHRYDRHLESTIVTYCQKSLIEITLSGAEEDAFCEFEEPFEKAQKVCLNGGFAAYIIRNFNKLFPNAHRLELLETKANWYSNKELIQQHFPSVTHLTVINPDYLQLKLNLTFTVENVKKVILLNPQIKSLNLKYNSHLPIDKNLLEFINQQLPQLETLDLDLTLSNGDFGSDKLTFDELKCLSLKFWEALPIPCISGRQLEKLTLNDIWKKRDVSNNYQQAISELVSSNKNISTLKFLGDFGNDFPYDQILGNLSKLNVLVISHSVPFTTIVWILDNCEQLKHLTILIKRRVKNDMVKQLKSKYNYRSDWTMILKQESGARVWAVFTSKIR